MGLPLFNEPVTDNVYLADFYRDKRRYAFPLQVSIFAVITIARDTLRSGLVRFNDVLAPNRYIF